MKKKKMGKEELKNATQIKNCFKTFTVLKGDKRKRSNMNLSLENLIWLKLLEITNLRHPNLKSCNIPTCLEQA